MPDAITATAPSTALDAPRLAAVIDATASRFGVPGGQVCVTTATDVVFSHAFGVRDVRSRAAVSGTDLFQIGSVSKTFAAIEIVRLIEQGRLGLDLPIAKVLPWLPEPLQAPEITVERLLQHRAGLVMGSDNLPDEVGQAATYAAGVSTAEPGRLYHYSNIGYVLLGLAIEAVTGRSSAAVITRNILEPLGMSRSASRITWANRDAHALGHRMLRIDQTWHPDVELEPAQWYEFSGADGAISCTATDLSALARVLLRQGDDRVLSRAGFALMTTRLGPGIDPTSCDGYGFGIDVTRSAGRFEVGHGGRMIGYTAALRADVIAGLAVVVLTNTDTPGTGHLVEAVTAGLAAEVGSDPVTDPRRWALGGSRTSPSLLTGSFAEPNGSLSIEVTAQPADLDSLVTATVAVEGIAAPLLWSGPGVATSPHPRLREHYLRQDGDHWTWGPHILAAQPTDSAEPRTPEDPRRRYCGSYRSYNAWFGYFRIYLRGGRLLFSLFDMEEELIEVSAGVLRFADDPQTPDRITFGAEVDGRFAWADRDGCRYSRNSYDS